MPTGNHVAIGSVDKSITHTAHGGQIYDDLTVWLWELDEPKQKEVRQPFYSHFDGHTLPVTAIEFSQDGSHMPSCSFDNTVRVWNVFNGKCDHVFKGHYHHVLDPHFCPAGHCIIVSRSYDSLGLWYTNIKV